MKADPEEPPLKNSIRLIAALSLAVAAVQAAGQSKTPVAGPVPQQQVDTYKRYVEFLADDKREGRGLGTKGIEQAAEMIETRLQDAGLTPAFGKSARRR